MDSGYKSLPGSWRGDERVTEYLLSLIRGDRRGAWPWLQRLGLWICSVPYGWATRARNWLFDSGWKKTHAVAIPVVSVGNLTVGGTGKTPCVEYVARFYRDLDCRVALLSRGYGTSEGRNDEAVVLEDNLPDVPHLQGADRVALAQVAIEELDSEVLVLDDGFQHRRLRRELDLVLIDGTAPWGYGYLLPRGLLREHPAELRRADLVMLTRCNLVEPGAVEELRQRIQRMVPGIPVLETMHRPTAWTNSRHEALPLTAMAENRLAGFCGIGNPEAFRRTLTDLGMDIVDWRVFPDHHAYTRADVESLRVWARQLPPGTNLVTTQKDLVKIRLDRLGDRQLWALKIELEIIHGKDALEESLQKLVANGVGEGVSR
jgi:tetraacyldisaccharide 4'-kinase